MVEPKLEDLEMIVCLVCGAIEGVECVEVFGNIQGEQRGCSACLGVSYFPFDEKQSEKKGLQKS